MKSKLLYVIFLVINVSIFAQRDDDDLEKNNVISVEKKIRDAERLINDAAEFLKNNTLEAACRSFQHDTTWQQGELSVMLIRCGGSFWTNPSPPNTIWLPMEKAEDPTSLKHYCLMPHDHKGEAFIISDEFLQEQLDFEGKWFREMHYNRIRSVYVRRVTKDDATYILTANFFSVSKTYDTIYLVQKAVSYFNYYGPQKTIETINGGPSFRLGEAAIFMMDMEGNYLAESNPLYKYLVGKNLIRESKEVTHMFATSLGQWAQACIDVASKGAGKGWVSPDSLTIYEARAHTYVEHTTDLATGKAYIIGASWWEISDRHKKVQDLVGRAITLIKKSGIQEALSTIKKNVQDFTIGWMGIDVFDKTGVILLSTNHPELEKQKIFDQLDDSGKRYFPNFDDEDGYAVVQGQGEWVNYIINKANFIRYTKKLVTPEGTYYVSSGYYPSSKELMIENLVRDARYMLEHNQDLYKSLAAFKNLKSVYFRGDSEIFVYTMGGTCLVHGNNAAMIWENYKDLTDQNGKAILQTLINIANRDGAGWATFAIRNAVRKVYVTKVDRTITVTDDKSGVRTERKESYLVGSGYYV